MGFATLQCPLLRIYSTVVGGMEIWPGYSPSSRRHATTVQRGKTEPRELIVSSKLRGQRKRLWLFASCHAAVALAQTSIQYLGMQRLSPIARRAASLSRASRARENNPESGRTPAQNRAPCSRHGQQAVIKTTVSSLSWPCGGFRERDARK